jgi:hypothetical protein
VHPAPPFPHTAPATAEDRLGADARGQRALDAPVGLAEPPGAERVDPREATVCGD